VCRDTFLCREQKKCATAQIRLCWHMLCGAGVPAQKKAVGGNVNVTLINYPGVDSITNKYNKTAGITQAQKMIRGRHSFCLSFPASGESSRNGATYPQSRGYLVDPRMGDAIDPKVERKRKISLALR
jgi:hypothetical protein